MADTSHHALTSQRTPSDLVASAADLLAGRVAPDEAIGLLARLLYTPCDGDPRLAAQQGAPSPDGECAVSTGLDPTDCLLWHAPSVVVHLWPDRWVVRSTAFSRVLGYPPEISHRHEPLALVHPADRGTALRAYVETTTGRRARRTVLLRARTADGGLRLLETTFVDAGSSPARSSVAVYAQDLTGRHADRVRLRELVPRLDHGVMVVDEAGYVRLTNETLTSMFGPRACAWRNRHEGEVVRALVASCRDAPRAGQQLAALVSAAEQRALRLQLADGRTVHLDRTPVAEADLVLGALWRFWDVSDASDGSARRHRLLATVSNELSAIAVRADELLSSRSTWRRRKKWRLAAETIARDSRRLSALVDGLRLLSQLESGRLSLRYGEIRVPELVRAAVVDRKADAATRGVVLVCRTGSGPALLGDEERLRRVLDELVRNATKVSARGSRVTVTARHEETQWTVVVEGAAKVLSDDGPGLAICRKLVELHHGSLTIVGAVARVMIPIDGRSRRRG